MYQAIIIGAGNIGAEFDTPDSNAILTHAHACWAHPEIILAGFYDVIYEKAEKAAAVWGGQAYRKLWEAVKQADMVICCVPDQYHGQTLKEIAAYRPKLVIAEKPIATSLAEAEEIQNLYTGTIPLMVNYSRRYIKEFEKLRHNIKTYGRFLKGIGYYGKGILHNGSHMIDFIRYLLGDIDAITNTGNTIQDFPGEPSIDAVLQICEGTFSMLAIDSRAVTIFEIELFFEKSRIRILDGGKSIEYYTVKESPIYKDYYQYTLAQTITVDNSSAMRGLTNNAVQYLKNQEKIKCTLEDGISVLRTCIEIQKG